MWQFRFLLAALLFSAGLQASPTIYFKLNGNTAANPQRTGYLYAYAKDRYYLKDSAILNSNSELKFETHATETGMYKLSIPGVNDYEFVVSPRETEVRITANAGDLPNALPDFFGSTENYCLQALRNREKAFEQNTTGALTARAQLDKFDAQMITKYDSLNDVFNKGIVAYNSELKGVADKFPHTFCGSVLAKCMMLPSRYSNPQWKKDFDNDNAFWHRHYFHYIDLSDPAILNFPMLLKSFESYLKNYTYRNNAGNKHFIDLLFAKPMHHDVRAFLLEYYLQFYSYQNNEEMVQYVFSMQETCNDSNTNASKFITNLKLLQTGMPAPALTLTDLKGKPQNLSDAAHAKKFTALVFYSTTCPHCIDFLKQLDSLYRKNASLFNVYTLTDSKPADAAAFNSKNGYNWINTIATAGDAGAQNAYSSYVVIGTPVVVLIDNEMKLITRFGNIKKLQELLTSPKR